MLCFVIFHYLPLFPSLQQILWSEPDRQQFLQRKDFILLPAGRQNNLKRLRVAEFHHYLAADAAGSRQSFRDTILPTDDTDRSKRSHPFADRLEERRPLRTVAGSIRRIFNVEALANGVSDRWNRRDDHSFDSYYNVLVGITYKFGTGFNLKCPDCKPVAYRNERYSESYVKSLNDRINELQGAIDSHKCPEPVPCPEVEKSVPGIKSHVSFGLAKTDIAEDQQVIVNPSDTAFSVSGTGCTGKDAAVGIALHTSKGEMSTIVKATPDAEGNTPYDIATGNDADSDRHGIVTPDGLMNPNHFLAVAIEYLFTHRPNWPTDAAIGKTLVSSSLIDRVAESIGRKLIEVPVGFKYFVPGLLDASVAFGGEESAGASFLRKDGTVWSTDKDGIILALLASEITAVTGKTPSQLHDDQVARFGASVYARIDAVASREEKAKLAALSSDDVTATELAGEAITAKLVRAPGNDAAIGGLKVTTESAWFAARPSGTEDVYKIYAESFKGAEHLAQVQEAAKKVVSDALS